MDPVPGARFGSSAHRTVSGPNNERAGPWPHSAGPEEGEMTAAPMNPVFLREAIRLSIEKMRANEGGPFGAVVVRDGQIIGRGWNRVTSTNDPTAHAEVVAIRAACAHLKTFRLAGCEIYCSCEPCPLCLAAIYWARLDRIYYAATCDDAAAAGFDDRTFYLELGKPAGARALPMEQALREEACAAFHAWVRKGDRIGY
jgi:tRNA(Arg) A34 adenosine deaminase TadA